MNQWWCACLHPPSPLLPLPPQSPVPAPHKNNSCVGIYIHSSLKNHCQHRGRPCLCTDQLPTADACSSYNLPLWFHGLQAQVPSAFLCRWWMMIVQTQHILPTAMDWVWHAGKITQPTTWAHVHLSLDLLLQWVTVRVCLSCHPHKQSMRASTEHLVLIALHDGCAQTPRVTLQNWIYTHHTRVYISLAELSPFSIGNKKKGCEQTFAELLARHCMELAPVPRHLLSPLRSFPGILWYAWQKYMPQIYIYLEGYNNLQCSEN